MRAGHDCACAQSVFSSVPLAERVSRSSYHGHQHARGVPTARVQSVFLSAETVHAIGGARKRVFLPWSPACARGHNCYKAFVIKPRLRLDPIPLQYMSFVPTFFSGSSLNGSFDGREAK